MKKITSLIRADGEFSGFLTCLAEAYSTGEGLPIAVNGLSGGAESAFLAEAVREGVKLTSRPVLVLVENENEREKTVSLLNRVGINAVGYKKRDFVFHNIRASHDVDRERLSVLSALLSGSVDAVVSTASAASQSTIPPKTLEKLSVSIKTGDIFPPEELTDRLVRMGFAPVDTVESEGQFSRRGGIVDFFSGESEKPIRIEFFGDEVDRMSYFDPLTQRTEQVCMQADLLPATEVMVDKNARERMLAMVEKLLKNAKDGAISERLTREKSVLQSDLTVDFRDKYFGLIYENPATLFSYFKDRSICYVLGTNGCAEDVEKFAKYLENEKQGLQNDGLIDENVTKYSLRVEEYKREISRNLAPPKNE